MDLPSGALFDEYSKPTSELSLLKTHDAFVNNGETVTSQIVSPGWIPPGAYPDYASADFMQGRYRTVAADVASADNRSGRLADSVGRMLEQSHLVELTEPVRDFEKIVEADVKRSQLVGSIDWAIAAGAYHADKDKQRWHHNNQHNSLSVIWLADIIFSPILGAEGDVSSDYFDQRHNLKHIHYPAAFSSKLRLQQFMDGSVLRLNQIADTHTSPNGDGNRLLLIAAMTLKGEPFRATHNLAA
jgi:hypothetical protein